MDPARLLLIRHDDGPDDDRVVSFAQHEGLVADIRRPFLGKEIGDLSSDVVGTVIYGGSYNAYDTGVHPFLREEYRWLDRALGAGIPVLGLCQGAQMIAHHAGAWVGAPEGGGHEFGLYPVRPTAEAGRFLDAPMHVTQHHFHTFDLPEGAVHLAESDAFANQAFRLGERVLGLQFHPEQTRAGFRRWQDAGHAPWGAPGAQTREVQNRLAAQHLDRQGEWFDGVLSGLFGTRSALQTPARSP